MNADELRSDPGQVASLIDHTNVEPDATDTDIRGLCDEVSEYGFCSAVVVPYHAKLAAELVGDVANVVVVVGFPYGVQNTRSKRAEVEEVIGYADEIDMVINRTAFANNEHAAVVEDIRALKEIVGENTLKCIIESPALSEDEVRTATKLVAEGGADFVKTAVGYEGGCDPDTIRVMRETAGSDLGVKASGGINTFDEVAEMVESGATRIGASAGVQIVESSPT